MTALRCTTTGAHYPVSEPRWRSDAGSMLDLEFTPHMSKGTVRNRSATLWRYREAIPIEADENIVSFHEGWTPLLETAIDGRPVHIKQDHLFQTGSYKDRGATVLLSKVKELGITHVVQDSSGNAGCSVAAYAARAGIACDIFVPESTSSSKLTQIAASGATIHRVPGSREAAAEAALRAASSSYYASHVWNPYFLHGTKTFAYEVCEQLDWRPPDVVVLPAGNGSLLLGAHLGFGELHSLGIIDRVPAIVAVQAAACAPLFNAFTSGLPSPESISAGATIAEGIAIARPLRGGQILAAVRSTHGRIISVHDDEIASAALLMASMGFFIEPTSAAVIAGLRNVLPELPARHLVVSVLTGHGLKATENIAGMLR